MRLLLAAILIVAVATTTASLAQQSATFRSNINMLAVDALVVDREGTPILGLLPEDFSVSVNGQNRRVVSAMLVKYTDTDTKVSGSITAPLSLGSVKSPGRVPDDARLFVIAVDEPSFLMGDMMPAVQGAQQFINNLRPNDVVGLYLFPFARPTLDLTHDHGAVVKALARPQAHGQGQDDGQGRHSASRPRNHRQVGIGHCRSLADSPTNIPRLPYCPNTRYV